MLNPDPIQRISLNEIKNHDWVSKFMKEYKEDFRKFSYQKNQYSFIFSFYLNQNIIK